MPTWPAGLDQEQFLPSSFSQLDNRLVVSVDSGPAKVRRRFTGRTKKFSVLSGLYTRTQMNTFWTFYNSDLKHGSLSFDWKTLDGDSTTTVRFDPNSPPPVFEQVGIGGAIRHRARFDLEELP